MALFEIGSRGLGKEADKKIANKVNAKVKAPTVKHGGLLSQIEAIRNRVNELLGKYKDGYLIITNEEELRNYIIASNKAGVLSIDTETTGLNPIEDKIVGLCLYTPTLAPAYVPINHVSYITNMRIDTQLNEHDVGNALILLDESVWITMFNAKFDIRVIKNQLGVKLTCHWDCYLASRLMNENETHKGLKALHQKYVLNDKEDEFNFESLFKGITFDKIPIDCAYLYGAHDAVITHELYEFQKQYLYYDSAETMDSRNGMNGVAWVFFNIEMPCVSIVADMEDTGVELDLEYAKTLSSRYRGLLEAKLEAFYKEVDKYANKIETYVKTHKNAKLDNPINVGSPIQIAILLYDIIVVEPVDKKSPRGTGEGILSKIDLPICKAALAYRESQKLLATYIDKLPECVGSDNRIHCNFNQYGADTGRFSSSDPNLQNIPSHNKDIRKMFVASRGIVEVLETDNCFSVDKWSEVNTSNGWKYADTVSVGDKLIVVEDNVQLEIIVSKVETVVANNQIVYYY